MFKLFGEITIRDTMRIIIIAVCMVLGAMLIAFILPDPNPNPKMDQNSLLLQRTEFFKSDPLYNSKYKYLAYTDIRIDSLFLKMDTLRYEIKKNNIKLDSVIIILNKK